MDVGNSSPVGNLVSLLRDVYDLYKVSKPLIQNAISPSASPPTGLAAQPTVGLKEDTTKICTDQLNNGIYAVMDCCQKRVQLGLVPGEFCQSLANQLQQPGAADIPENLAKQAEEVLSRQPAQVQTQSLGNQLTSIFLPSQQHIQQFNQVFNDMVNTYNKQKNQPLTLRLGNITTQQTTKQFPVTRLGSLSGQGAALGVYDTTPIQVSRPSVSPQSVVSFVPSSVQFVPFNNAWANANVQQGYNSGFIASLPVVAQGTTFDAGIPSTGLNMNNVWAKANLK